jgi:Transposase DDE domain group 1
MADPTGEADGGVLRLDFDRRLMLRFRGSVITSDAGLLPYRELDDAVGLTDTGADRFAETRTGKNIRHLLRGLLRQSVFGRLAGYEDVNDADRLCRDPAMRWVVGDRAPMGRAASASQMGRFETEWLARPENLAALGDLPGQWIDAVHKRRQPRVIVLDMDSSESPTYGEQEGSAYNGHFGCTCYHPLFVFNQLGDLERCALRPGNVHSAEGWRGVLEPVVARYRDKVKRRYFRGDAAFANPEVYEFLEAEGMGYAIRLPAGAAADVPGNPVAHRAPSSTAGASMTGRSDCMRQATTAEVRLDEGKPPSSGPATPSVSPFWLSAGWLRSNFVAAEPQGTEDHVQTGRESGECRLKAVRACDRRGTRRICIGEERDGRSRPQLQRSVGVRNLGRSADRGAARATAGPQRRRSRRPDGGAPPPIARWPTY